MSKSKPSSSRKPTLNYVAQVAASLPPQAKDAVAVICESFARWQTQQSAEPLSVYAEYLGFFALLNMHAQILSPMPDTPELSGDKSNDIALIMQFFSTVRQQLAMMTLDLSLITNVTSPTAAAPLPTARFYQLTKEELSTINDICDNLQVCLQSDQANGNAWDLLREKQGILREQLLHNVVDVELGWRYISQYSVTLDASSLEQDIAVDMLRRLSSELWRIQARAEKLPDSTLKTILLKLTNPTRWEQESISARVVDRPSDESSVE